MPLLPEHTKHGIPRCQGPPTAPPMPSPTVRMAMIRPHLGKDLGFRGFKELLFTTDSRMLRALSPRMLNHPTANNEKTESRRIVNLGDIFITKEGPVGRLATKH